MNRLAAAAALALASLSTHASELAVGVHTWSWHEPGHSVSNDNPGVFVRFDGLQLGVYRNSVRRTTVYAAAEVASLGPVSLVAGIATGYGGRTTVTCSHGRNDWTPRCVEVSSGWRHPVIPLMAASIELPTLAGVTPRLKYVPRVRGMSIHTVHLTLETSLWRAN